ncbi:MAG: sulfite exporter TauE/SafE family protein, partial [Bacteroidetes bacterium HGW-Bacteroidetes-13]
IILGITLIVSSAALVIQTLNNRHKTEIHRKYPVIANYILGGVIGFLAGLVGIGGGIFLAPILNHLRWEKSLTIAALTSFFILVNSISGLSGLFLNDTFQVPVTYAIVLMFVVLLGGQLGTRITLRKLSGNGIKRLTALLVFSVGIRVLLVNGLQINF